MVLSYFWVFWGGSAPPMAGHEELMNQDGAVMEEM